MDPLTSDDIQRKLNNLLRTGVVFDIDHQKNRARVKDAQGWESNWLRWTSSNAAADNSHNPPQVGEQVLVASLGGESEGGLIIGAIHSNDNPPPFSGGQVDGRKFEDGAYIKYDAESSTLSITIPGKIKIIGNIEHQGSHKQTGDLERQGKTKLTGDIEQTGKHTSTGDQIAGGISQTGHKHTGIRRGGSTSNGPV